jgi:hypothetical protein
VGLVYFTVTQVGAILRDKLWRYESVTLSEARDTLRRYKSVTLNRHGMHCGVTKVSHSVGVHIGFGKPPHTLVGFASVLFIPVTNSTDM